MEPVLGVELDEVLGEVVTHPFIHHEPKAGGVAFIEGLSGLVEGAGRRRIYDSVVGTVDHEYSRGVETVHVADGVVAEEVVGFGPEIGFLAFPDVVGVPGIDPMFDGAGADEGDDRGESGVAGCDGETWDGGGGTAEPAELGGVDILTSGQEIDDAPGIDRGAVGAEDVAMSEPLVEEEPLRLFAWIRVWGILGSERGEQVAFVEQVGAPERGFVGAQPPEHQDDGVAFDAPLAIRQLELDWRLGLLECERFKGEAGHSDGAWAGRLDLRFRFFGSGRWGAEDFGGFFGFWLRGHEGLSELLCGRSRGGFRGLSDGDLDRECGGGDG